MNKEEEGVTVTIKQNEFKHSSLNTLYECNNRRQVVVGDQN